MWEKNKLSFSHKIHLQDLQSEKQLKSPVEKSLWFWGMAIGLPYHCAALWGSETRAMGRWWLLSWTVIFQEMWQPAVYQKHPCTTWCYLFCYCGGKSARSTKWSCSCLVNINDVKYFTQSFLFHTFYAAHWWHKTGHCHSGLQEFFVSTWYASIHFIPLSYFPSHIKTLTHLLPSEHPTGSRS